jgi:hypothetical protein
MAQCFLEIPATSAPSEQFFSQGFPIVSWQQSALQPDTIEQILCEKFLEDPLPNLLPHYDFLSLSPSFSHFFFAVNIFFLFGQ